jgi:hypothetical protein
VRLGYEWTVRCGAVRKGKVGVTSLGRRPSTRKPVRGSTYSIAGVRRSLFVLRRSAAAAAGKGLLWRVGFLLFRVLCVGCTGRLLDPTTNIGPWLAQPKKLQALSSSGYWPGLEPVGSSFMSSSIFFSRFEPGISSNLLCKSSSVNHGSNIHMAATHF